MFVKVPGGSDKMPIEKFDFEICKEKFAEVRGRYNYKFDMKEEQINIACSV